MWHWILRGLFVLLGLMVFEAGAQPMPPNASPRQFGSGWQCNRGFYRSANECLPVQIPQNAELNFRGDDWQCRRGFYRSGSGCSPVQVPQNAELNFRGDDWQCRRGFYRAGNGCTPVQIPQNAELNFRGDDWQCRRGFYRLGSGCSPVQVPQNAELNFRGDDWQCKPGYAREGVSCRPMTAEELKAQNERTARAVEAMRKRAASADCETESQSGAEICLTVTSMNLDCDKAFSGTSYSSCSLSISYTLKTDYRGQSSIDADVECSATIDTKKRNGFSGSERDSNEESHTLYANDSDSETMRLSFNFSSFEEVYGAKVSSAQCEIDDVTLN